MVSSVSANKAPPPIRKLTAKEKAALEAEIDAVKAQMDAACAAERAASQERLRAIEREHMTRLTPLLQRHSELRDTLEAIKAVSRRIYGERAYRRE